MAYKQLSPIIVQEGGTGAQTLTDHGVLIGSGTAAITPLAAASTGQTLMGVTGADPSFTGSPSFSGSVTAGTTITATSGAITATSGNVVITSGNLTLPTTTSAVGQIIQNGTRVFHTYSVSNPSIYVGSNNGNFTTTGVGNVFVGDNIGVSLGANANGNTMIGAACGVNLTTGNSNSCLGFNALYAITTGVGNIGLGYGTFNNVGTSASYNIGIGASAGSSATGTSSSNICINNAGATESNTLRIGSATGTGATQLNASFIHGIRGITTGNADAIAVLIDSAGQLGTVSSSIRFKENVQDLPETRVLELRPVRFNYKQDGRIGTGLIAEEVEQVMPQLVALDDKGEVHSVKYHDLPVLLLAEIQKLRKELDELKRRL